MWASTVEVTWPASGSTARELSGVLGSDSGRPFNRGRCSRRRSISPRGWPVVPEGGRHDTVPSFASIKAPVAPLSSVCRAWKRSPFCGVRSMAFARLPASSGEPLRRSHASSAAMRRPAAADWNIAPAPRNGMDNDRAGRPTGKESQLTLKPALASAIDRLGQAMEKAHPPLPSFPERSKQLAKVYQFPLWPEPIRGMQIPRFARPYSQP